MPRAEGLAAIERINDAHIRARWRKAATGGISADDLKPSVARLAEMLERMDRALEDAPWLAGDEVAKLILARQRFLRNSALNDTFMSMGLYKSLPGIVFSFDTFVLRLFASTLAITCLISVHNLGL